MIESLEPRRLMADVTALQRADGPVYVTGTESADHLRIFGGSDWDASIDALDGTTINGDTSYYFGSTNKPVIFNLGNGDDTVVIDDGGFWSGEVGILGGGGNDRVTLPAESGVWISRVYFAGGDGDDSLGIVDRTIGDVLFEGGNGRDRAYLDNVVVHQRLRVADRNGPTNLTAVDVAVGRDIRFDTGNAADRLSFWRVKSKGLLYVQTRGGTDTFYRIYSTRFASKQINLGDEPADRYEVYP